MPHSCRAGVMAFLNRWSTTAQERCLWPGSSAESCQQKALQSEARVGNNGPNAGWVRPHSLSSWLRTNRSAWTAPHIDNKRVTSPQWGGDGELVGKWSKSTEQWRCDLKPLLLVLLQHLFDTSALPSFSLTFGWIFFCFDSDNAQVTSDVSHSVEECACHRDGWTDLRVRNWKFAILARS